MIIDVEGSNNPALVAKQVLCSFVDFDIPYEVLGKEPSRITVDEASFDAVAARCGDMDAPGFIVDSWSSIANLCRLGGFTIELANGVFRAR